MIGFKKTPTRLVFSLFFISIILILLIYLDYEDSEIPQEETIYEQESVVTPTEKLLIILFIMLRMEKIFL